MGAIKKHHIDMVELRFYLEKLLKETGALVPGCDNHETLVDAGDPEALVHAYCRANKEITNWGGGPLPAGWKRRDITDFMKRIVDEAPDQCPDCANCASKD